MKKFLFLPALVAMTLFCSCEKQSEAERKAEVERQVQERLAAERQTQEQQQLASRVAELEAARQTPAEQQTTVATEQAVQEEEPARQEAPGRGAGESSGPRRRDSSDGATASYSTFYNKLEPHGEWRETSDYGYVWQPREAHSRSWRPYTNGRWVYTDAGWTWMSEEPFGWATYHYGRWARLRNIGWVWVPGDEWAPAWVSWRKSNDYVGWAPLPPEARFERGTGIHNWADNYYDIGPEQYSFVATNQFGDRQVERALVPAERNITIVNQTTNVTNITYSNTTIINNGPSYDELRTRSQQPIERLRLERQTTGLEAGDLRSVVRGGVLEIHAPSIARAQAVERPRQVKEKVGPVVIEHGWEGFSDRQAVDKARVKMRAEATPPPNAPSRTFVKATETAPAPAASAQAASATPTATAATTPAAAPAAAQAAATATATATVASESPGSPKRGNQPARKFIPPEPSATATATPPPSSTATPLPTATPRFTPPRESSPSGATPSPHASAPTKLESPTATPPVNARRRDPNPDVATRTPPPMPGPRRISTPPPSASPAATAAATASPAESVSSSQNSPPPEAAGKRGKFQSQALKHNPPVRVPMTSPGASSPAGSPATEASPAASLPAEEVSRKEEAKQRRRERAAAAGQRMLPSPSASPSAEPH